MQFNGRSLMYFGSDKVGIKDMPHRVGGEAEGGLRGFKIGRMVGVTT